MVSPLVIDLTCPASTETQSSYGFFQIQINEGGNPDGPNSWDVVWDSPWMWEGNDGTDFIGRGPALLPFIVSCSYPPGTILNGEITVTSDSATGSPKTVEVTVEIGPPSQ